MPKASIIVPVYKVEKYLNRCIESILNQSYTDFELILVDDGSPDNCPQICDEYARKDKRVIVIHKENGGLSDARNTGIEWALKNSNSEWITFIDSDDYIKENLLEKSIFSAIKYNVDIICFGIEMRDENLNILSWGTMKLSGLKRFNHNDRFAPIVQPKSIGDYAVNKLYKKHLFYGIYYPKGKIFEDVYTTYKIFDKAESVAIIRDNLYVYVRRSESITRQNIKFDVRIMDFLYSNEKKFAFIKSKCNKYLKRAAVGIADSISVIKNAIYKYDENIIVYGNEIKIITSKLIEYLPYLKHNRFISKNTRRNCKFLLENIKH